MKKLSIILFVFFVVACSKVNQPREVFVENSRNEKLYLQLDGWQNIAEHKLAFLQHGLASNLNHSAIQKAKQAFLDKGYFVVTFDSRYSLGKSDGDVRQVKLSTFVEDLTTVIAWAQRQPFYSEPFAIVGHSLGGASVIHYAFLNPQQIDMLIPITPVVSGNLWEKRCMKNMPDFCEHWKKTGFYEYHTETKTAVIPYQLIEDTKSYNALKLAQKITAKTLLISAENDIVIDPQDVKSLSEDVPQGKFVLISHSGHNFETDQNQTDLYDAIYSFIE